MTIIAEVETVDRLVPVTLLLRLVLDQNAYSGRYSGAFLQVSGIYLLYNKDLLIILA